MDEDAALLRRYADEKSEEAFAVLVSRHLPLVYSVALRQVAGDAHLAEDVAQQVFTALARKAAVLAERSTLSGWLYRSTHFAASDVVRIERRRRAREQKAHAMNSMFIDSTPPADWDKIRPVLDAAIAELDERDRDAVALRFFDGRSFADVGAKLRLTENAARMRVERALDKLHAALARRGVSSTAAAVGLALANQAVASVPAGVAASVIGAALSSAATGSVGAALTFFTMNKLSFGIAAALLVAGLSTTLIELRGQHGLRAEIAALQSEQARLPQAQAESRRLSAELQKIGAQHPEAGELAQLRDHVALLKSRPEGVTDAQMKPTAACQNVGRATPEAAIETDLWAMTTRDLDALMSCYSFSDAMKVSLAAFFAKQSDVVRQRYGTPERLLGALWQAQENAIPAAFQVLDAKRSFKNETDAAVARVWFRRDSGEERATTIQFQRTEQGWEIASHDYQQDTYDKYAARIDQATGEIRP